MATNLSTSRSRTSTPVRAITSTLSSGVTPSIPPASELHEPLVKSVLRQRLIYSIFLYTAVFSWIQTTIWTVWGKGGLRVLGIGDLITTPFLPSTLFVAFTTWLAGALPVVILRKVHLTVILFITQTASQLLVPIAIRSSSGSPSKTVQAAFSKRSTVHAFITYTVSALLVTILHTWMAYANEPRLRGDRGLTIFVESKKHPYYLNGRFVFLSFSQVTLAYIYCLRNVMLDRFVFRWPTSLTAGSHKWPLSFAEILGTLVIVVLLTSFTLPCSTVLFAVARSLLPFLYETPLSHLLRPLTAHFLRGPWTIWLPIRHFSLLCRACLLNFSTMSAWEASEGLFDAFITQRASVAYMTADPALTLVSGVTSPNAIFKYFAYSELRELATDQSSAASSRRTALFGDQKYAPNLWSTLVREGLVLLGQDYQLLLRRGKAPPPATAPPAPTTKATLPSISSTSTPLIKKPIYQPTKQSPIRAVMNSLASDGPFSQALDAGADAVHLPELVKSVEDVVLPSSAQEEVKKRVQGAKGIITTRIMAVKASASGLVSRYSPLWAIDLTRRLGEWWTKERISKVVEGCLPRRELDVVVVDVLSHFTCASLTEDRYGVVQRDIPKILEALLSFLSAIEDYQMEINALYTAPTPDQQLSTKELEQREVLRMEIDKAGAILGLVGDGLKEGVARIVRTFGNKLVAFKFPPITAKKLQGFLDYC